jgi:hypothetical protein
MAIKEDKSTFCIDCNYVFDKEKKYHAQDRCNACYQKLYVKNQIIKVYGVDSRKKLKSNKCSKCEFEYETLNNKGKVVKRGPKNMCKTCYTRSNKPVKICKNCGNQMLAGSSTGLCPVCRFNKPISRPRKVELPEVDKEQFELIRRLLARYKVGHNNYADAFRVADIYMDVNNNPILLDTLSEESQIVEMLRNLQAIFYYNLEKKTFNPVKKAGNTTADMKAYRKEWYRNNKERILKEKRDDYRKEKEKVSIK